MASIADIKTCAESHLRDFVDPTGKRSFATYDRRGDPSSFEPIDALAPLLLDAPLRRREVNQMFSGQATNSYNILRVEIQMCLEGLAKHSDEIGHELDFADANLEEEVGPWALVKSCYRACSDTHNIKASKVSKLLHRKQPTFIPIIDSKLVGFYGLTMRSPKKYWAALQEDFRKNRKLLDQLAQHVVTSEGNKLSSLRAADIIIWQHLATGCKR